MVGILQRGDADVATIIVRSDTIGDTAVRLGPAIAAADSVIMGTKLTNETSSPSFVTDIVYNVDITTYWLLMVLVVIVISLLTSSEVIERKLFALTGVRRHLVTMVNKLVFKAIGLIVDQEDYQPSLWSGRFLWFHFCLALFFLIFGILLNTMSTDITVTKPATYVESIDYFLDTTPETRRKPIVFEDMLFHTAARRADKNSKLGQLKHIMDTTPGCYFKMDPNTITSKLTMMISDELLAGKSVLIYPEFAVHTYFERLGCTVQPEMMSLVHTSKQSMTPGTLHPIYSHRLPHPMLKYIEYRAQTAFELHLLNSMLDFVVGQVASDNQLPRTLAYYKCMEHEVENSNSNLKQYMTLHDIKPAFQVILGLLAMASIILIAETVTHVWHKAMNSFVKRLMMKLKQLRSTIIRTVRLSISHLLTSLKKLSDKMWPKVIADAARPTMTNVVLFSP